MRTLQLSLVYRPPTGSLVHFTEFLRNTISDLNLLKIDTVLIGDYNINYNQRNSRGYKLLKSFERDTGLKQLINSDTRVCQTFSTRIDLILSNMKDISKVLVLDDLISDHFPITIIKKHQRTPTEVQWVRGRLYKKYDGERFKELLELHDWENYYKDVDPNSLWDEMKTIIESSLDTMCPIKTFKVQAMPQDWMTPDIRRNLKLKKSLLKQARKTKLENDWTVFKNQRRLTSNLIRRAKSELVKEKLNIHKDNPRKFWEVINESFGNLKNRNTIETTIVDEKGKELQSGDMANYMNEFFCSIGKGDYTQGEIICQYCRQESYEQNVYIDEFEFVEVTSRCVRGIVMDIDVHKSSSILHLNSRILKESFLLLLQQLTHLFNCSLGGNIFPSEWKLGKIVPIPKNKEKKFVTNWRHISLLALPGKLLEKVVHKQLFSHLKFNKLLSEKQHGFTKNKSTSTAFQDFIFYTSNCINKSQICSGIYIDLSKAFDSLDHSLLLYKLRYYGIKNKASPWFSSYLYNRSQKTVFNGVESSYMAVSHGVPQGSTLGPLLYIMYVNDCFDRVKAENSNIIMYADDTVLLSQGATLEESMENNQLLFNQYIDWADVNCLKININKTKSMTLCSRYKKLPINNDFLISKGNQFIHDVKTYTYLGVDIDSFFTYESFLKSIVRKVNYKLYLFSKIRFVLTFSASILVYKQMVLPFFDYLDIIIDSGPKKYIDKLQALQFRGIKIIYQYCIDGRRIKNEDENLLHKELRLSFLVHRRRRHVLHMMYKLKDTNPDMLDTRYKGCELRSSTKINFKEIKLNSDIYVKSPYVRGCYLWKQLPLNVQTAKSLKEFDRILSDDLLKSIILRLFFKLTSGPIVLYSIVFPFCTYFVSCFVICP